MIGLLRFVVAVLVSAFKSKIRLEAENASLRHQLVVLRRQAKGRAHLTNNDRWFLVQMYRWFPLILEVITILCYLPYLSVGWGVFGFLTKGYLTEEGISAGYDLWLLSLWRLVFGEHQGDVVAYVVLAALVLLFKGLSVARSAHHTIASSLAGINMLLLMALLLLSPNYPWYFLVITPFAALCGSPP